MTKNFKSNFFLITYAALLIAAFINVNIIIGVLRRITAVMMPFFVGVIIAYIINWPYTFFMRTFKNFTYKKILSLVCAYTVSTAIFIFLILIIIPNVVSSIISIINASASYYPKIESFVGNLPSNINIKELIKNFFERWDIYLEKTLKSVLNFTKEFTVFFYNLVIGFIVSIYILSSKKELWRIIRKIFDTYLNENIRNFVYEVFYVSNNIFGRFLKGKLLDSGIVGLICFAGMIILRIPYAILISVIVCFTNVIPFFGPFFGAIPSIIILLVENPLKAIWFAIFIFVLQQIDGNLIGPKILGDSIGISGIFIILSVLLGGGLFGVPGMVLGVPVFSVIYTIFGKITREKEILKNNE